MHIARLETVFVSVSVATTRYCAGGGGYHHQMLVAEGGYHHQMSLAWGWVSQTGNLTYPMVHVIYLPLPEQNDSHL